MQTQISKEMTFDCAHMLSGHRSKCANLHGHTYKIQLIFQDELIDKKGDTSEGMVIDFADLKQLMQEEIIDNFDHAVIFSDLQHRNEAEEDLYHWAVRNDMRYVVLPCRTTAENMAAFMAQLIRDAFCEKGVPQNKQPSKIGVRLWETPTSCVEVFV